MEARRPRSRQELRLAPLRNERFLCRRQGRKGKRNCGDRGDIRVGVKQTAPGLQHNDGGGIGPERNVDGEQIQQSLGLINDGDTATKGSFGLSQRAVALEKQQVLSRLEQRKVNVDLAAQSAWAGV